MRNSHKLVLCFCFLKAVCLVPDLYNYFQSNMDRVLLIMTEYSDQCSRVRKLLKSSKMSYYASLMNENKSDSKFYLTP